ncbi:MAG: hypothetical protein MI861_26270 [Pirellulales bacterium]|nr:hypothetical protein [Pirellulales bacterium]
MMNLQQQQLAAQTVVDLAGHMQRLRQEAQRLQEVFQTRQRGFFTPSEDDQVAHLWISYHKSRNALLELIDTIRDRVGKASEDSAVDFTIAYAAALVLVDAARSLRQLFSDNSLVRRKLNEAFQSFGIEKGSFDAIQKSLTDPANAVRLKKANEFFDQHAAKIRAAAQEHGVLAQVLEVVDALAGRSRVSSARYVKARVADRSHEVKDLVIGGVKQTIYLIQEFGSRLVSNVSTAPGHVSQLPGPIAQQLLNLLRAGDVLVTRKENALTNYFLPGYWPHAALFIGQQRVIESLKDGVRERNMDSPLGNDAVAVIRPRVSQQAIVEAITRAHSHVGKPYDFDFDFTRADRMVCT